MLDGSTKKVAVDAVGAKPGDWVICVSSSAAREAAGSKSYPSDLTIVGIIDHWEPDPPKTSLRLHPPVPANPRRQGQLMEIMQVMGTLICTYRVAGLDHMHLRILRNNKGKKLVAVDPVGAREGNWCSPPAVRRLGMPALTTPSSPI